MTFMWFQFYLIKIERSFVKSKKVKVPQSTSSIGTYIDAVISSNYFSRFPAHYYGKKIPRPFHRYLFLSTRARLVFLICF